MSYDDDTVVAVTVRELRVEFEYRIRTALAHGRSRGRTGRPITDEAAAAVACMVEASRHGAHRTDPGREPS